MSTVKWCAGGYSSVGTGNIAYSYDGINWSQASTTSLFGAVFSIAHNGTIWIVGSNSLNRLGYSYDGINWSASANGNTVFASGQVIGVAYGNNMFVAVGSSTNYTIAYSYNGIDWTGSANNSFFGGGYGYCVTYNNSTWVAGSGANGTIGYSSNGINWTAVNTGLAAVTGIDWNGTYWVIVGQSNTLYSTNLTTWNGTSGGGFATLGRGIKWNGSKFISVGQDNDGSIQFKTSTNGVNWTGSTPTNTSNPMMSVNYSPYTSSWVIGKDGSNPLIYSTDNGVTWTNSPSSLSYFISVRGVTYALPPPYSIGTAPTINSITNISPTSFAVNFTSGTGGIPPPITYYYSLNGGAYVNANSATSPLTISGVSSGVNYNVTLIANNLAGNTVASNISVGFIPYPCFLQGTRILRMNQETDDEEYVPVETLRRGDLIKTANHGYKAVELIGKREIENPLAIGKNSSKLYWFRKSKVSGLREDLCVTGDHCILHKHITATKKDQVLEYMGDIYVTEDHYRVPAFLDDRAEPYRDSATATIWHFALENPNIYHNYGVYANGLLVESSSLHFMYKYSNMRMI